MAKGGESWEGCFSEDSEFARIYASEFARREGILKHPTSRFLGEML